MLRHARSGSGGTPPRAPNAFDGDASVRAVALCTRATLGEALLLPALLLGQAAIIAAADSGLTWSTVLIEYGTGGGAVSGAEKFYQSTMWSNVQQVVCATRLALF